MKRKLDSQEKVGTPKLGMLGTDTSFNSNLAATNNSMSGTITSTTTKSTNGLRNNPIPSPPPTRYSSMLMDNGGGGGSSSSSSSSSRANTISPLSYRTSRGRAIPLITFATTMGADGKQTTRFSMHEEARDVLMKLEGEIAVISVAGKYRTGKSYLLNRGILGVREGVGFGVGPTTQACTRGIWMYTELIDCHDDTGHRYKGLVLDSEGIGSTDANSTHDARIMALTMLLSSKLIFNSSGAIDEAALATLQVVADVGKNIKVHSNLDGVASAATSSSSSSSSSDLNGGGYNDDSEDEDSSTDHIKDLLKTQNFSDSVQNSQTSQSRPTTSPDSDAHARELGEYTPEFTWVLRDFTLIIKDERDRSITPTEYMENALRDPGSECDAEKRKLRAMLRAYFPRRDCHVLVRPCNEERELQTLDNLPDERLRDDFRLGLLALRKAIYKAPCKTMFGKPINPFMFAKLCETYVDSINNGNAPVIRESWALLSESQCREAKDAALKKWKKSATDKEVWKCAPDAFARVLGELRTHAETDYRSGASGACEDDVLKLLRADIAELEGEFKTRANQHVSGLVSREVDMIESQVSTLSTIEQLQQLVDVKTFNDAIMAHVLDWSLAIAKRQVDELRALEGRLTDQAVTIKTQQQQLDTVQDDYRARDAERALELEELRAKLADGKDQYAHFEEEYRASCDEKLRMYEDDVVRLKQELQVARERASAAQDAALETIGTQATENGERDRRVEELQLQKDSLEADKAQVESEIEQMRESMNLYLEQAKMADSFRIRCTRYETERAKLLKDMSDIRTEASETQTRLQEQINALQQEFSNISEETTRMSQQEQDQLAKQLADLKVQLAEAMAKRQALETQASANVRQIQELTRSEESLKAKNGRDTESFRAEISKVHEQRLKMRAEYDSTLSTVRQKHLEEMNALKDQNAALEQQRIKERADYATKIRQAQSEASMANARLEDAKKKENGGDLQSRKDLLREVAELRLHVSRSDATIAFMTQEKMKMEATLSSEESRSKRFESQCKDLQHSKEVERIRMEMDYQKKMMSSKRVFDEK